MSLLAGLALVGLALGAAATGSTPLSGGEVNVYSYRQPGLVKPLFDKFTEETGIEVNVLFAKKGLAERLRAEGRNSPADLILTTDIGRLTDVKSAGLTQPVSDPVLAANIPAKYRDPEGHWFGLTARTRAIFASKDRVDPKEITTYEALADPKWKGRICIRSGAHPYNVALVASVIARNGEAAAEKWLRGLKANLARKPQGNDRAQIKAVYAGECDIALANNYYYGKMLAKPEQKAWAEAVNIIFAAQGSYGAHMNLSGMAMAAHAPNRENAIRLMEFLASDEAQGFYAEQNYEYPVKPGVAWSPLVESWGRFREDDLPLQAIAENRAKALKMVQSVRFDDGPES